LLEKINKCKTWSNFFVGFEPRTFNMCDPTMQQTETLMIYLDEV
jgi:hypothetical protein